MRNRHSLPGPNHTPIKRWHHDPRWRLVAASVVGIVAFVLANHWWRVDQSLLLSWAFIGVAYSVFTLFATWRMNPDETATHARGESPGHVAIHLILLVAAGASLVGLIALIVSQHDSKFETSIITLTSVVASWLTIQVVYMLRYARMFYDDESGIDFNQSAKPQYSDFAYVSFTMGMTFAPSDTSFTDSAIRKVALGHSLLTYVFGTMFLAAIINILASFGS
jgi:uncharacterized membrane protein